MTEKQIKRIDKRLQSVVKQYNENDDAFGSLIDASRMLSLMDMAYVIGYNVDKDTGKLWQYGENNKTRIYVSE